MPNAKTYGGTFIFRPVGCIYLPQNKKGGGEELSVGGKTLLIDVV